ncbi:PRD domain-containing protein [Sporosalibacterium faouarense]|uniref:PRD domain-containing protein n=1 Tax=Sporosalibacterium faouarense TaxID=516123 RepID=UPI00141C15F7|nr:PRD domain-containing protein [Sporosalibacterium faouarense]MTI46275.1 PRD domain-containing protein [Bacillota bacterium]
MKTLNKLKKKLNIKDEDFEEIVFEINRINKKLKGENIILNEQLEIGLYSHIISFINRLRDSEKIMSISDEVLSQLDEDSIELSKTILEPLFIKYDVPIDMSEVALVAIHLQTARENSMKGGEN